MTTPQSKLSWSDKKRLQQKAMAEAIALLKSENIHFSQPDAWTIRFSRFNYWPGTRKLYRDGTECSLQDQGLTELKALLKSIKERRPIPAGHPLSPISSLATILLVTKNSERPVLEDVAISQIRHTQ